MPTFDLECVRVTGGWGGNSNLTHMGIWVVADRGKPANLWIPKWLQLQILQAFVALTSWLFFELSVLEIPPHTQHTQKDVSVISLLLTTCASSK